jgi:putative ABC transport system ATP-binding protein
VSPALELRKVSKTRGAARHAVRALDGVSLAIAPGEFVLLEGPSGSGKTTLLALAAGLLPADQGEVVLDGRSLASMTPAELRRWRSARVGFVFQRANLLPALRARENVMLAAVLEGRDASEASSRTNALLEALGVAALAERRPHELSGGEEQRVAVARALVHGPAIVLADEPTAHLDWNAGKAVAERLSAIARERGAAVLVATHDARLAPFSDRTIRLADGRIV